MRGEVGAPGLRRAGILCLCLPWLGLGCGRQVAEAVLGCASSSFLFQRSLFSSLGKIYGAVRRLPARRRVPLPTAAADEVFAAGIFQLAAVA